MDTRYIYDAVAFSQEAPLNLVKDFVSIRLDRELKTELTQAAELEHRSLSSFSRLLLEFAWGEYLKAGSLHGLLVQQSHHAKKGA